MALFLAIYGLLSKFLFKSTVESAYKLRRLYVKIACLILGIKLKTEGKLTGILFVKRESKDSRSAVRQKMIETLKNGYNVLVYPEGTVNHLKQPLPYRPGTFATAVNLGIPIVPIVLEYKRQKDLWFKRKMVAHFFNQFGWPLTSAKLCFGPPMHGNDPVQLKEEVEKWTINKITELHKGWNSVFDK